MPSTDANPLPAALTDGAAPSSSGSSALPQRRTLGEKVTALGLIAPTLLNWAVLAHARCIGTAEVVDSDGESQECEQVLKDYALRYRQLTKAQLAEAISLLKYEGKPKSKWNFANVFSS